MSVPTEQEVSYIYLSKEYLESRTELQRIYYLCDGLFAMNHAVRDCNLEKIQQLQEMYQEDELFTINHSIYVTTPLNIAVLSNYPDILLYLLENCGGDPNYGEINKPLDIACEYDRLDCLKILLGHGADPAKMRDPKLFEKPEIQEYLSNMIKMTKSASKV